MRRGLSPFLFYLMEISNEIILKHVLNAYIAKDVNIEFVFEEDDGDGYTNNMWMRIRYVNHHPWTSAFRLLREAYLQNKREEEAEEEARQASAEYRQAKKLASQRYVYLMRNNVTDKYKIGRSNNPEFREKTLQSQEPDVELLFSCHESIVTEKYLHELFSHKRIRGEWFELDSDDVLEIRKMMQV